MDPVTAFGLAAGVLQVIGFSFEALSKCREIYKDGSLARNRATEELTEYLATTTKRLEESVHHASSSASKESKDVLDVSQKCSETAAKLLSELRKLKRDAGGGTIQALALGVRTIRRKKFLAESQERLEKYQSILDTRILAKLDAQSILQNVQLNTVDQNVKDLALALSQGRNTVVQLLSEQTVALRDHIDRRFDDQAQRDAIENAKKQFKESLFFPEIFARQDNITRSHEGTCRWIFGTPKTKPGRYSVDFESNSSANSEDDDDDYDGQRVDSDEPYGSGSEGSEEIMRVIPRWSSFAQWLLKGEVAYWLSGNPGSGKSTLMKYISTELRGFCQGQETLNQWDTDGNLLICSFFFWKLGSSLQKDYTGFLRSILYQIAEQREDLIPILMGQHTNPKYKTDEGQRATPIYAWTKERLDNALRCLIANKPASINLCLLVDGLDEFDGDEDLLLETINFLSRDPGTRICVSSRPEQIFRLGFAKSPQLRLHDLNYRDIKKATMEGLKPMLEQHFSNSATEIDDLVKTVTARSQGVFLWADLMCKDLRSGARNCDSMRELFNRLNRTPGDIQGLYGHMLSRLDELYIQEAAGYFRLLLTALWNSSEGLTILHIACGQEAAWKCVLKKDFAYFQSFEFRDSCRKLETRILTRCAGLVEIAERRNGVLKETGNGPQDLRYAAA
ncbi:hypothetical protein G7Y79_00004g012790 [Physcia stellaris]|nr:hypothetical protein G7Y79_00004g012790 [Physcia stellaris]